MAATVNSSWTPHGPRSRSLPKPRMRLRCANSISTCFRRFWAVGLYAEATQYRAKSLTISYSSRRIRRVSVLMQHLAFDGQFWQSDLRAP